MGYQGGHITRQGIYERVRELGLLIGIPNLSPHDLCHYWTRDWFLYVREFGVEASEPKALRTSSQSRPGEQGPGSGRP